MELTSAAIAVVRTRFEEGDDVDRELFEREANSSIQALNAYRGDQLFGDAPIPTGRPKIFNFRNVKVNEDEKTESVFIEFDDGYTALIRNAEITNIYPTTDYTDYGPQVDGMCHHPNTGTTHLVRNSELMCGRDFDIQSVRPLDTVSESYSSFCSQCVSRYDGFITTAADLDIQV